MNIPVNLKPLEGEPYVEKKTKKKILSTESPYKPGFLAVAMLFCLLNPVFMTF
jgi:hypothetical protein